MKVIPYQRHHLSLLRLQAAQEAFAAEITDEYAASLEGPGSYTAVGDDGRVLIVAGITDVGCGRGIAWALVDREAGARWTEIHKAARKALDEAGFRRVEATVQVDFKAGHRWLKMLGFQMEAERMRAWMLDGQDASLYSRVV